MRIDRLARSVVGFVEMLDRAQRRGWDLRLLSPDIDTRSPSGRFIASILSAAGEYERNLLSVRTSEGMRQRQAEGVRMGRPSRLPVPVVRRILDAKAQGATLRAIAEALNAEEVATAQGGAQWHASSVAAVLRGQDARALAAVR